MANLIYLASPYSHPSEAVRYARYLAARAITIEALQAKEAMFSPIVYGKDLETIIGTAFEPWTNLNDAMIEACWQVRVLCLHDWQKSRGVRYEIALATHLQKPILYIDSTGKRLNVHP